MEIKNLKIKRNISVASYTTFKIGGRADYFVETDAAQLPAVVNYLKHEKIPYQIIAGGSNVVFADGRIRGAVVRVVAGKNHKPSLIRAPRPSSGGNGRIVCEAGLALGELVKFANKRGLTGIEKLAGIPGSVGGAVVGSAGAYGHSIRDVVEKLEIFDSRIGKRRWLSNKECKFSYRESIFKTTRGKNWLILRVVVKLKHPVLRSPKHQVLEVRRLQKTSGEIIKIREKKYRPGLRCPGSFFRNVQIENISKKSRKLIPREKIIDGKVPAGWLLEQVGAKGLRHGRVKVADFHGNLFINSGGATCKEVKELAGILKDRVRRKFGIELEEEVRYCISNDPGVTYFG